MGKVDRTGDPASGGAAPLASEELTLPGDAVTSVDNSIPGTSIVPKTFGRFEVRGRLGRGGMGEVLEAFDDALDRPIALKILHPGMAVRHGARLVREAKALARLSHPNVVQVYEVGEVDGRAFVAMELVRGKTLARWQRKRPPWQACVERYLQAGRGLAAAHEVGLVHRDFKPTNCIVDEQGHVRVLDFGLARTRLDDGVARSEPGDRQAENLVAREDADGEDSDEFDEGTSSAPGLAADAKPSALTAAGAVLGTVAYMPLEQLSGQPVDEHGDQFSFCVSLYEALYGQRPFADDSVGELTAALMKEKVRPVPKGSTVPGRVRKIVLRGLAAKPSQRWPTMQALLAELEAVTNPPKPKWWTIALVGGATTAVVGGLLWERHRGPAPCTGSDGPMVELWNEARQGEVEDALVATGVPYAADTWSRVKTRLDGYADAWSERKHEVCAATLVHRQQTAAVMELRNACLSTRRLAFRETVDVLANADRTVAEQAVTTVAGLPAVQRCDDIEALRLEVPPPTDAAVAERVLDLRERLTRAAPLADVGLYEEAETLVNEVLADAEPLGYEPLLAEVLLRRGDVLARNGQYEPAEQALVRAYSIATELGHARVTARTAQRLVDVVGGNLVRHAEGNQWGVTALALAKREAPAQVATTLASIGSIRREEGKLDEALEHHEQALSIRMRVLDDSHPLVGASLDQIGLVLRAQGQHELAQQRHEQALAIYAQALGPGHPRLANTLNNLGVVADGKGELAQAVEYHERALQLREQALGGDHPDIAVSVLNLGLALRKQGRLPEARAYHERALNAFITLLGEQHPNVAATRINYGLVLDRQGHAEDALKQYRLAYGVMKEALGPDHSNVATVLDNIGIVLHGQGRLDEALDHHRRALAIRQRGQGPEHPEVGISLGNVSRVLLDKNEPDAAVEHLRQARAIFEKGLGPDHPRVSTVDVHLARAELSRGRPEAALVHAQRAATARERSESNEIQVAYARFVLGRCLWFRASERKRARALVEQARATYAKDDGDRDSRSPELVEIDAWITQHPAPG